MKNKQQIIEELTKIVELHINGEDTRRQFIEDADSWLSQTLDTFEQEVREDERGRIKNLGKGTIDCEGWADKVFDYLNQPDK